jgi:SAM-dependent methyltransferase
MREVNSVKISRMQLLLFGLSIGLQSIYKGDYTIGLKRIILPINYWRLTIFKYVSEFILNFIDAKKTKVKILDIGSPKKCALFLSSKINGTIYATDLQDKSIFTEWKKYYLNMSKKKGNIIFEYANAKKLPYENNSFDIVYIISVLHMITPVENGDIVSLKEIQRIIKPGGKLIIEIPRRDRYNEIFCKRDNFEEKYVGKALFSERLYDDTAIEERILKNVSGNLMQRYDLYEKFPFDYIWQKMGRIVTTLFAFLEPWIDMVNISIAKTDKEMNKAKSTILFFKIQ